MPEQPAPSPKPRRRWWLWLLIAVLALVGWWWVRRTRTMVLVARVPLGPHTHPLNQPVEGGLWPGLLTVDDTQRSAPGHPGIISMVDWNGQTHWSVQVKTTNLYQFPDVYWWRAYTTLSPDGRRLAIMIPDTNGKMIQVRQWCDGRPAGEARFSLSSLGWGCQFIKITDAGRVWIASCPGNTCKLLAIDGTHVANGTYTPPPGLAYNGFDLSADGASLLLQHRNNAENVALQVQGEQVICTLRYTSSPGDTFLTPLAGGFAVSKSGALYHANGLVHGAEGWIWLERGNGLGPVLQGWRGKRLRLYDPRGRNWEIPAQALSYWQLHGCCSVDGNHVLLIDSAIPRLITRVRGRLGRIAWARRWVPAVKPHYQLARYDRPGHLAACLPLEYRTPPPEMNLNRRMPYAFTLNNRRYLLNEYTLSPDGQYVGLLAEPEDAPGKQEWLILR